MPVSTIEWIGDVDGHARIVEQTLLPGRLEYADVHTAEQMRDAIRRLAVRGAPAIGIAAAMGVVLGVRERSFEPGDSFLQAVEEVCERLASARPTAVNLFWALDRMRRRAREVAGLGREEALRALLDEALAVLEEDRAICRRIGEHGAALVPDGGACLTHCNAGGLATADYGTALAVFFKAHEQGKRFRVYVDETRPLLQGARITAWELLQAGIDTVLICDSVAAVVLRDHGVGAVVVGADRIARNGDVANKIGTYGVSVLARAHSVPFYVAAPTSTFDLSLADGKDIPIEERPAEEVTEGFGVRTAPEGVAVFNPAFDVTPHENVAAIVTEFGLIERPNEERVVEFFRRHCPDRLEREAS